VRHIIAPDWVVADYEFPVDVEITLSDDLADVAAPTLATADLVILPYLGSGISIAEVLAGCKNDVVIQTLTAGFDNVLPFVTDQMTLCNAAGVHDDSTSEMALALTLAALRDLPESVRAQERGQWVHYFSHSLADKNVLLIGYGGVGKAIHRRLTPFECTVVPVARTARENVQSIADVRRLIPVADIVILAVPLDESTNGLVNAEFLALLKDGALLVNVARGPVVDTSALIAELKSGRITAALDVTDPEPIPEGHELWQTPGLLISPHLGGDTDIFEPRARKRIHRQLDLWLSGQPLECVIHQAR
jgi:phosphoglycerate dehydrogenase-like enzyme